MIINLEQANRKKNATLKKSLFALIETLLKC